jgi:hypothetical protein
LIIGNNIVGASGPASGYNVKLSYLFIVFVLFLYRLSVDQPLCCHNIAHT